MDRIIKVITLVLFISLLGCDKQEHEHELSKKVYEAKVMPDQSTATMISEVKSYYQNIDPGKVNYALNNQKANLLQAKLDSMQPGSEMNVVLYDYADELLRAGRIDEAIVIFEDFHDFFKDREFLNKRETMAEINRKLGVVYIRKAEIENCVVNHNNESCILPLSEKAQYEIKEYTLKAIQHLEAFLEEFPGDYEVQYLLNIAHMTIGQYPDQVSETYRIEPSYFERAEFPKFKDIAIDVGVGITSMSGGVCIDDFNNDGYLDLMVSSWGVEDQITYFQNDQKGAFTDRTEYTGLVGVTGGLNLKHADYNNDGFVDFIILRGAWLDEYGKIPNSLIRNNGDGTFSDVTKEAGLFSTYPTQTAVWSDFNLDGWLDLFIGNESLLEDDFYCELYMNNQDGTFTEIGQQAGFRDLGYYKGVSAGDVNNDGFPDLYLSDYYGDNRLYINTGNADSLSFELSPNNLLVAFPKESFPTWMFDYNNDGWEDIFVSAYSSGKITPVNMLMANMRDEFHKRRPYLYENNGDGTFTYVSPDVGLTDPETTMGCNYGDLDNDGFLDFYLATGDPSFISIVPNKMYHNRQGESFEDVTFSGGFGHIQKGHAIGFGDLDMDGDQDIYAVMGGAYEGDYFQNVLYENPGNPDHHWIHIKLEGTKSNRSGIGTKIRLTIQNEDQPQYIYHTVSTGASFGGNSLLAEIGVGTATSIDEIRVTWPNRDQSQSVFNNVGVDQHLLIKEGQSDFITQELPPIQFKQGHHMHH